eukprot:10904201-Alexandrium_andersonii.AAC.1
MTASPRVGGAVPLSASLKSSPSRSTPRAIDRSPCSLAWGRFTTSACITSWMLPFGLFLSFSMASPRADKDKTCYMASNLPARRPWSSVVRCRSSSPILSMLLAGSVMSRCVVRFCPRAFRA